MTFIRRFIFFVLIAGNLPAFGQTLLKTMMGDINTIAKQLPIEKLYLQTDKTNYVQGDTIWFKGYLLNADNLTPSVRSGLLYIELDDMENICIKRMMVPVAAGLTWGNMALIEDAIPEGSYTLRGYTNWMRNFGEDYVFAKNIYVASTGDRSKLVLADFNHNANNVQGSLLFTDLNHNPIRLQDMQLHVLNGRRTLFKKTLSTGVDGKLDVDFELPENTPLKNLSVIAAAIVKKQKPAVLRIPVMLQGPEDIDLQFMPEGGAMVAGISSKIGFKAVGTDGMGVAVSGKIYDGKQQEVASFASVHKGIGSFELKPKAGEVYFAKLTFAGGASKNYALPAANAGGTTLRIENTTGDSIRVRVAANVEAPVDCYLIAESGSTVCYGAHILVNGGAMFLNISPNIFPTGIIRFTLLNAARQPLNERLLYIDHDDGLCINIAPGKLKYALRDSISVDLQVTDHGGAPVKGDFSIAVTDDTQVKTDSLSDNIVTNMLFTADLKGYVEQPGYYFAERSPQRKVELDNLLLTQGWVGYSWQQVFGGPVKPAYAAEQEFVVTGRVSNPFNKPVEKAGITLMTKRPVMAMDTMTNKEGRFSFPGLFPVDTAVYFIQARRKNGSNFGIRLDVDEFKQPVFTHTIGARAIPWYVNSDTLMLHNRDSKLLQREAEQIATGHGHMLKEVTIKNKRIIKTSRNLNGPGEADYILDEKDMATMPHLTLYDILQKKYPYISKTLEIDGSITYRFKNHIINFIIDGIDFRKQSFEVDAYIDYLEAGDILGIEIMYTSDYALRYDPEFIEKLLGWRDENVPVYMEITTRSGHGAFLKKGEVTYLYKPVAYSIPKEFYRPRYTVKKMPDGTDQRSTIHWEPDAVTGTDGKTTVSFYSADKPASYTITVQGTDLNGRLGFAHKKIWVR